MRDHTKLRAFELADEVAVLIYRAIRGFPKEKIGSSLKCMGNPIQKGKVSKGKGDGFIFLNLPPLYKNLMRIQETS